MLPQEVWKQRREAGIHGRVPTRKEWDGHRKALIGTMTVQGNSPELKRELGK
jgi:hypothetical protein